LEVILPRAVTSKNSVISTISITSSLRNFCNLQNFQIFPIENLDYHEEFDYINIIFNLPSFI
jgi:hypothetical protein